jgi:hypothetical protein
VNLSGREPFRLSALPAPVPPGPVPLGPVPPGPVPPGPVPVGLVLIITVIVAWLVEIARGHNGNPYGWLGAIAGLTYIGAVAFFRWRG